jgi:hypothetical protein
VHWDDENGTGERVWMGLEIESDLPAGETVRERRGWVDKRGNGVDIEGP